MAAYYVVAEALTNAAKHACASQVTVDVKADDKHLRLSVTDDGVGGAVPAADPDCSGSRTESRRWAATSHLTSRDHQGTTLAAEIPCAAAVIHR